MKELVKKIAGKKGAMRCRPIAEAYLVVQQELAKLEGKISERSEFSLLHERLDQVEEVLDECFVSLIQLEKSEVSLFKEAGLSLSEYLRLKEKLNEDYDQAKIDLNALNALWSTNGKDWQYAGDFLPQDNRFAEDGKSNNWILPTIKEVIGGLKPEQLRMYLEMEKWGVEPKLQITPIDLKLDTLKTLLLTGAEDYGYSTVLDEIKIPPDIDEKELQYDVKNLTNPRGHQIELEGGVLKWPWIGGHRGFLFDIVSTKQWVLPELRGKMDSRDFASAQLAAETFKKLSPKGYSFLSYEAYLINRWQEIRRAEKSEEFVSRQALNLGSMCHDQYLPITYLSGKGLGLAKYSPGSLRNTCWVPFSIRLNPDYV
jgi:hypothetical protein